MKRITTNLALWLMAGGIASFAVVYKAFGQFDTIEISSGLLLGACVVLALTWLTTVAIGISKGTRGGAEVLALGLFSIGLFEAVRQAWSTIYRINDRPIEMLEHWSYPFIIWCCFWSVGVILLAPGTRDGDIPTTNKVYLAVAAIIGALAGGIAIGMSLAKGPV